MKLPPDKPIKIGVVARDFAAAFALFTIVTVVFFAPELPQLSSALLGPQEDNFQDFWNVWYVTVASNTHHFFETNLLGFPQGQTLTLHTFAWPQLAVIAALTKVVGTNHSTLLLLQNILRLLSFPTAGASAFLLVQRIVHHRVAGLVGAFVFAFNPWHVSMTLHHANVSEIGCIALFAFAYLEALEKHSKAWLAVAVLADAMASLSMLYYFFYIAFFMAFHLTFAWAHDRERPRGWDLAAPFIVISATLFLLLPIVVPMLLASTSAQGTYRGGWDTFLVDVSAFLVPPPTHFLGRWTQSYFDRLPSPWEGVAYIGIANIALLVTLFAYRRNKRDVLISYVFYGMALFAVLSLGLQLHVGGYNMLLPLPDALLWKAPVLSNLRTPARFFVMVSLYLSIAVGYALSLLIQKFETKHAQQMALAAVAVSLVLVDFWPARIPMSDAVCPADFAIIRNDPEKGFGVLTVPFNYVAAGWAMFGQTCHNRPIVQFNLARVLRPSLVTWLEQHDMARQKQQLMQASVKYIVLIPQRRGTILHDPVDARSSPYFATYRVVTRQPLFAILKVY